MWELSHGRCLILPPRASTLLPAAASCRLFSSLRETQGYLLAVRTWGLTAWDLEVCSLEGSLCLRPGRHWHHSGIDRPREVSLKPPPGLEAGLSQLLSNTLTPELLLTGLGSSGKHLLNHFFLQSVSFFCPRFICEATLGLWSILVAWAGTQSEHPGSESRQGANRQAGGDRNAALIPLALQFPLLICL